MVDAKHNLDEAKKEAALWRAKLEVLDYIYHEIEFTEQFNDTMSESFKAYYITALDLLSEGITEYGILPWND